MLQPRLALAAERAGEPRPGLARGRSSPFPSPSSPFVPLLAPSLGRPKEAAPWASRGPRAASGALRRPPGAGADC